MNRIKVNLQQSITVLAERGWSKRRIARELNVDRATVTRHLAANAATNPALGSSGVGPPSVEPAEPNAATNSGAGSEPTPNAATNPGAGSAAGSANAASNPGVGSRSGPASRCAPYEAQIVTAVDGRGRRVGVRRMRRKSSPQ
ncbi:MAG: helix-turn-helix domain-containing protein [Chloroflexi bacterium]|nr:helix-turn-helix domain-containing protein [Chloroflexota bacterium]